MVPNIITGHWEQFLFSSYCSTRLYFEIAVKFSFQEHARPPRIQVEKKIFDSRFSKSGLVLKWKVVQNHYLTSRKLWGWPQTWPFLPFLEGEMGQNWNIWTLFSNTPRGPKLFCVYLGQWSKLQHHCVTILIDKSHCCRVLNYLGAETNKSPQKETYRD